MTSEDAKLDIKTTKTVKATLEQAANVLGITLNTFVLDCAMAKARDIIAQSDLLLLNRYESERFVSALQRTPKANEKLNQLFTKLIHE